MRPRRHAVAALNIFDGTRLWLDAAVLIDGPRIAWVGPRRQLPSGIPLHNLPGRAWLAPGFIDIQLNGGGDVLFNADPTGAALERMAAAHRRFGTTAFLPTLISDTPVKMLAAIEAVATSTVESVIGIHLEGPFLSPQKCGVHDPRRIRDPRGEDFALVTSLRKGTTLLTLAPERVPSGFIAHLVARGVRVALGHSMATYVETKQALAEGMTGFTHLFNAMRPIESREPGPIAAALEAAPAWFGMIVDGSHVHPSVLRLALRGSSAPMIVTDAMPPVGGISTNFSLDGRSISVRGASCVREDGVLAGSALDMASAIRNTVELLAVPLASALRYASTEPARFLGIDGEIGRLAPGLRADMVALEPAGVRVLGTWLAGQWAPSPSTGER